MADGCTGGGLTDTRSDTGFTRFKPIPIVRCPDHHGGAPKPDLTGRSRCFVQWRRYRRSFANVYYWKQGLTPIPGAATNTLLIPAVQFTNAGVYTMYATNSQGQTPAACWLSVAATPGSNNLAYQYTNYPLAGLPLTMNSYITNVSAASNTYQWEFNRLTKVFPPTTNLT